MNITRDSRTGNHQNLYSSKQGAYGRYPSTSKEDEDDSGMRFDSVENGEVRDDSDEEEEYQNQYANDQMRETEDDEQDFFYGGV